MIAFKQYLFALGISIVATTIVILTIFLGGLIGQIVISSIILLIILFILFYIIPISLMKTGNDINLVEVSIENPVVYVVENSAYN